jgi:alanine racemase
VLVSLRQIARNYSSIRAAVGEGVETAPVVKANAYGHGLVPVARELTAQGARILAVACTTEAVELRAAGVRADILIMGGALPGEEEATLEYRLTPVLHSLEDVRRLDAAAVRTGLPARFHLKIDTGMGRLGVLATAQEIAAALGPLQAARLTGLMTHPASGPFSQQTEDQLVAYRTLLPALGGAGIEPPVVHAASSTAIAYGRRDAWYSLVRPGLSLYGYVPDAGMDAAERLIDVAPALTWKARLLAVKQIPAGALVGYGGTFRAPHAMRIGVVAAGYADGVFRNLSNRGLMIAAGRAAPILGIVSMDVTTIDLTEARELQSGDEVTLLGAEGGITIDAATVAAWAGTIPYDVLCRIGPRVARVYE